MRIVVIDKTGKPGTNHIYFQHFAFSVLLMLNTETKNTMSALQKPVPYFFDSFGSMCVRAGTRSFMTQTLNYDTSVLFLSGVPNDQYRWSSLPFELFRKGRPNLDELKNCCISQSVSPTNS